jgi:succinoglycan biosynthesis protein ExoA
VSPDDPPRTRALRPFVSVIVPVRQEARHIGATLAALLGGDYPADRIEVLVIDGRSTDGTRAVVESLAARDGRFRLLDNPAGTAPAGLNIGLRAARGEIIVRMDAHTLPAPDYVTACVDALERTGAWAVGGPMVGRGETAFGRAVAVATATRLGAGDARFRLGGAGPVDTVYLGAWPRAVLDRVGGFDEGLPRNQDYELAVRIRAAGGMVWLDPGIRSTTVTRGTPGALARQYFGYGTGRAGTWRRHPRSLRWRQTVPALLVAVLALAIPTAVLNPRARPALGALSAGYAGAVALRSASGARRADARAALWPPVAYATIHLAWGIGFWLGLGRIRRERNDRTTG